MADGGSYGPFLQLLHGWEGKLLGLNKLGESERTCQGFLFRQFCVSTGYPSCLQVHMGKLCCPKLIDFGLFTCVSCCFYIAVITGQIYSSLL